MSLVLLRKAPALLLWAAIVVPALAANREAPGAEPGQALPIYVDARMLAEAEKPTVELAPSAAFWSPGPELFYGWALRDLRDCLQRVSGSGHPLTLNDPSAARGVFAGTFAQFPDFKPAQPGAAEAMASVDPEAFVIEAQGDKLFLLGKSDLGLIGAVYTFLDKLGCKWFAPGPDWAEAPENAGLTLDARLNAASAGPSYRARFFFPSYGPNTAVDRPDDRRAEYALWCLRNRMGGSAYTANYHNAPIIDPALFATRPELFALVKGKRVPYELSRGNPEAVELATKVAVDYLKANAGKGSYYDSFSVETADGAPACEESLPRVGNHTPTDLDFWFANQIAAGLERAGLTDKWVGLYSYSDHAAIPSFDLHPRVGVMVTTSLDTSSGGLTVEQRLDGLRARKAQRLGIYEYLNLVIWTLEKPGSNNAVDPLLVAANLRRWHDHGARTYMAETSDSWVNGGAGHYMAARVLWDVRSDPRAELEAYYRGAFGPAATLVRALFEDWVDLPVRVKLMPGSLGGLPDIPRGRAARWHEWITAAEKLAKGEPRYRARLNDLKRYYLYLNLTRELELELSDPRLGTKAERYARLLRYVGSQRGQGAFHALGLLPTLVNRAPDFKLTPAALGDEFAALSVNLNDEAAWRTFPPLTDAEIDARFAAARLPLDGHATLASGTFDPRVRMLPVDAKPPAELRFPVLHTPPAMKTRHVLHVVAPTPRLTFEICSSSLVGGVDERLCIVADALDRELKRVPFAVGEPVRFELADVSPGFYTVTFPAFGAAELTVTGGNTFGAVRSPPDNWGFNPMRRADHTAGDPVRAYFLVPAGWESLRVRLTDGTASLGFVDGPVLAADLKPEPGGTPRELAFAPSDQPRVAVASWAPTQFMTTGFFIEGVTLFSPDPGYVLYETLE